MYATMQHAWASDEYFFMLKLPKFFFKSCRVGLLLFGWLTVPCPNAKNAWCISNLDTDKRDVLLLDNASIHKTGPVMDAIVFRGLTPCFLPPYTPEFQPIEHCFSVLKARYRMLPPAADLPCGNDVAVRVRHSMLHLRPESLTNMFRACWERAGAFASFEIIRAPGSGSRV